MSTQQFIWALALVCVSSTLSAQTFSPADIINWEPQHFSGSSSYSVVNSDSNGKTYLKGSCTAGNASGLFMEEQIPITSTTELRWQWRIPTALPANERETSKAGDDFSARIYVVVKRGFLNLSSRAINYVWSSKQRIGDDWPNPFTDNAHMVAVSVKTTPIDAWHTLSRNIQQDFNRYHGIQVTEVDSLAVMVDCDNHGAQREFHLANIYLGPGDDEGAQ